MSVISSTQSSRRRGGGMSSRRRRTKDEEMRRVSGSFTVEDEEKKKEMIDKAIPILGQVFAQGFFTEVNCRSLPEPLLEQLALQVYQFVQKQGLSLSLSLSRERG